MKKISIIMALGLLLNVFSFGVAAEESAISNDYRYTLIEDGKAVCLLEYLGTETDILVPAEIEGKPVKMLDDTFMRNAAVVSITIPENVEVLMRAFFGCTSLQTVQLPETLFAILGGTFRGCTSLTDITLPDSVYILDRISLREFDASDCSITIHAHPYAPARHLAALYGAPFVPILYDTTSGDLNGDGIINTTDARLALQSSVGKISLSTEQLASMDVNQDQKTDTTDARFILQYAVGLPVFPSSLPNTAPIFNWISAPLTHVSAMYKEDITAPTTITPEIADPAAFTEIVNEILRQAAFEHACYTTPPLFSFDFEVDGLPAKLEYKMTGLELTYRGLTVYVGGYTKELQNTLKTFAQ